VIYFPFDNFFKYLINAAGTGRIIVELFSDAISDIIWKIY